MVSALNKIDSNEIKTATTTAGDKNSLLLIDFRKKVCPQSDAALIGERRVKDIKHYPRCETWPFSFNNDKTATLENVSVCLRKGGCESFQITSSSFISYRNAIKLWLPFWKHTFKAKSWSLTFWYWFHLLLEPLDWACQLLGCPALMFRTCWTPIRKANATLRWAC